MIHDYEGDIYGDGKMIVNWQRTNMMNIEMFLQAWALEKKTIKL